jgi:hypothetical protein
VTPSEYETFAKQQLDKRNQAMLNAQYKDMEASMNRDYFNKPIQSSRNMHDYCNSGPIQGMDDSPSGALLWGAIGSVVGGLVVTLAFFAWIG